MTSPLRPVAVFAAATGNAFMTDIASWIVEAAAATGRTSRLVTDALPDDPGTVNFVLAPHEFFLLADQEPVDVQRATEISVPICTEQPGTPWFALAAQYVRTAPLVLDINESGATGLRRLGIPARRLALGGGPGMVGSAGPTGRDIDVLFLGGDTERRRAQLSRLGPVLAEHRSDLRLFRFSTPIHAGVPGVVFGADKYDLLARARILVNIHRDDRSPGYFEWARMVEAMANGVAVVTEPSTGHDPLVAGTHFVEADDVPGAVRALLDDPDRIDDVATAARDLVLGDLALAATLGPLLDELDGAVPARAIGTGGAKSVRSTEPTLRRRQPPVIDRPLAPVFRPFEDYRARLHRAWLREQDVQRSIEALRCELRHGAPDVVLEFPNDGYRARRASDANPPDVSVVVTVFDYAAVVTETLDSLAASRNVSLEIVVVDDHSRDASRHVVRAWADAHADVPVLVLGRETNGGLSAARNLGVEHTRAAKVMMMDADNTVYPRCLRRLSDELDAHPDASFAYATLEAFGPNPGLRSQLPWYVPWLCEENYIDAQAMVRRDVLDRHGGYRTDDDVRTGWEDWDLWLRLAAAGEYGTHVAEMLGRYRTQHTSMVSMTNMAADLIRAELTHRYPTLAW